MSEEITKAAESPPGARFPATPGTMRPPAPRRTTTSGIAPRYSRLFVGGQWRAPRSGRYFDTVNPATEQKLAEIAEADDRDVDDAVQAARRAYDRYWSKLPGREARQVHILPHRAGHPGAVRASSPSSSRWTAAKADQGVARRRPPARGGALLLPRGVGRQARARVPGPALAAARGRGADHPVELPAPHGGVEAGAGARLRKHGRPQASRDHAAHARSCSPASSRRPSCRRGWSTWSPAPARPGRRWRRTRASTRSRSPGRPRSARRFKTPGASPAAARSSPSSSGGRPPTSSSPTRRSTRRSRASSVASTSTRGTCAARDPASS